MKTLFCAFFFLSLSSNSGFIIYSINIEYHAVLLELASFFSFLGWIAFCIAHSTLGIAHHTFCFSHLLFFFVQCFFSFPKFFKLFLLLFLIYGCVWHVQAFFVVVLFVFCNPLWTGVHDANISNAWTQNFCSILILNSDIFICDLFFIRGALNSTL